ncbi:MAG: CpsB/CapC family capsule biosynthesis tyrosine phosphatase [Myxococcota bacterium]
MKGFVDLHCHYLPSVDDGVSSTEEGVELVKNLKSIGYDVAVATPHIRTAMFPNHPSGLRKAFQQFVHETSNEERLPELGLGAEHYFDDRFWELFLTEGPLAYPGGHAALVEFSTESIPMQIEHRFFEMNVRGIRPVLAHPERYRALFRDSKALQPSLEVGVLPLLDLMSLVGKYGRRPRKAAERMLDEGLYYAACSDTHRPRDVELVQKAIQLVHKRWGEETVLTLLIDHPRRILEGDFDD